LAELAAWDGVSQNTVSKSVDFLKLAPASEEEAEAVANQELKDLKIRFKKLQAIQKVTFDQLSKLREERSYWAELEDKRDTRKVRRRARLFAKQKKEVAAGANHEDEDMAEADASHSSEDGLGDLERSSTSDEESAASEEESTASDKKNVAWKKENAASEDESPASEDESPASEDESPASEDESPASVEESAASEDEIAASDDESDSDEGRDPA